MKKVLFILCALAVADPAIGVQRTTKSSTFHHHFERGIASVYTTHESGGHHTASGERLSDGALTAAHRTLPFGSKVRVTNQRNGRSILVLISDRGPFVRGRIIDLTLAGARSLGFSGLAPVTVERVE